MGGGGDAAGHQGHPGRPPRRSSRSGRPAPSTTCRSRITALPGRRPISPADFDLWDNIFLGRLASHPWGAMRFIASVIGGGIMDRYPDAARRHPRMRLRLAAVLGPADGRAVRICRQHRQAEASPRGVPEERPLFLQRSSGTRARTCSTCVTQLSRRRRADVRLRLPAFGMPVPEHGRRTSWRGRASSPRRRRSCCGTTPAGSSGRRRGSSSFRGAAEREPGTHEHEPRRYLGASA